LPVEEGVEEDRCHIGNGAVEVVAVVDAAVVVAVAVEGEGDDEAAPL